MKQLSDLGLVQLSFSILILELPALFSDLLVEELEPIHLVLAPLQLFGPAVELGDELEYEVLQFTIMAHNLLLACRFAEGTFIWEVCRLRVGGEAELEELGSYHCSIQHEEVFEHLLHFDDDFAF